MFVSLREERKQHKVEVVEKKVLLSQPVNSTVLNRCLYIAIDSEKLSCFDKESGELLSQENRSYCYKLNIIIYNGDPEKSLEKEKVLYSNEKTVSINSSNQLVITWDGEIISCLARLFPFSEGVTVLGENNTNALSKYIEKLGVLALPEKKTGGGIILYPEKQISVNDAKNNTDDAFFIECLYNYGYYPHISRTKTGSTKDNNKMHNNNHIVEMQKSTPWMDAKKFSGDMATWENYIYSLASEPDANGICDIYIGEATNSKDSNYSRLKTFSIGNKTYIGHNLPEATERKFTRFRIDKMPDDATEYLHYSQNTAIGIATMLSRECPSGYRVKNYAQGKSYNKAIEDDHTQNKR